MTVFIKFSGLERVKSTTLTSKCLCNNSRSVWIKVDLKGRTNNILIIYPSNIAFPPNSNAIDFNRHFGFDQKTLKFYPQHTPIPLLPVLGKLVMIKLLNMRFH